MILIYSSQSKCHRQNRRVAVAKAAVVKVSELLAVRGGERDDQYMPKNEQMNDALDGDK